MITQEKMLWSLIKLSQPGWSESFEVDSWVVKVGGQSRNILFKKCHPKRNAKQSILTNNTNQLGGNFRRQPATFDNLAQLIL